MSSVQDLIAETLDRWGDHPSAKYSAEILKAMSDRPRDELKMLTYYSFQNLISYPAIDEILIRAINLLANTSVHALDMKLLFIDDEQDEYEIEKADLKAADLEGGLPHPQTGKIVPDYEKHVYPYYAASKRFIEAIR